MSKMIEMQNDIGQKLLIELDAYMDNTPYVTVRDNAKGIGQTYKLTNNNIKELKEMFDDEGISLPKLSKWLQFEGKEIISVEHLQTLLDAANFSVQTMYKQRDNIVAAINKIEPVFEIYKRLKENNNED